MNKIDECEERNFSKSKRSRGSGRSKRSKRSMISKRRGGGRAIRPKGSDVEDDSFGFSGSDYDSEDNMDDYVAKKDFDEFKKYVEQDKKLIDITIFKLQDEQKIFTDEMEFCLKNIDKVDWGVKE